MRKKELEKIVKFLCRYNKDDIGASAKCYGFFDKEISFKYLYDGKLMETEGVLGMFWSVVSNDKEKAIIQVNHSMVFSKPRYYELNKATANLTDITEYYKPKEKETEND
jgi:hypothetical protein